MYENNHTAIIGYGKQIEHVLNPGNSHLDQKSMQLWDYVVYTIV